MNERYYDALDAIESDIQHHHIKLEIKCSEADFCALVLPTCPMIIVNLSKVDKKKLPIVLLHEFAHILLHTNYDYYSRIFDNKAKVEDEANTLAAKLALDILKDNDGYIEDFDDSEQLRENLGMPNCFESNIERLLRKPKLKY